MTCTENSVSTENFVAALQAAINRQIQPYYPDARVTLITFAAQGNFHWYYQDLNQNFNRATFDYVSARVSPGDIAGTAQISPAGGFPNAYARVATSLAFVLGSADQETLDQAQFEASLQAGETVARYEEHFGAIRDLDLATAREALGPYAIASKIDYVVAFVLGYLWSGRGERHEPALLWTTMRAAPSLAPLLPDRPEHSADVLEAASAYLRALGESTSIQDELNLGGWSRQQLLFHTEAPGAENGGMRTVDPATGKVSERYQVGYSIEESLVRISRDLADPDRVLRFSTCETEALRVDWSPERFDLRIPTTGLDFVSETGVSSARGAQSAVERITLLYPGFSLVPIAPEAWDPQGHAGWYDARPIAEARANVGRDASGFHFVAPPPYNLGPLDEGGDFGRLTHLLISGDPTIEIDSAANESLLSLFRDAGRLDGSLCLLDFAPPGSPLPSAYALDHREGSTDSTGSTFRLRLAPVSSVDAASAEAEESALANPLEKAAHVIGGIFDFPGVDSSGRGGRESLSWIRAQESECGPRWPTLGFRHQRTRRTDRETPTANTPGRRDVPSQNPAPSQNPRDPRHAAIVARDASADGTFVYAVKTTGVYCRPSCPSRPAKPENIELHDTIESAEAAGFRPCKRCRPGEASAAERRAERVESLCRLIEESEETPTLEELAAHVGQSPFHVQRVFKEVTGETPRAWARARRAERVRETLGHADTVTEAIYGAGYGSSARFYEQSDEILGMKPAQYRDGGRGLPIRFAIGECSLGSILVAATERGVCAIHLGDDPEALVRELETRFGRAELVGDDEDFAELVAKVVALVEEPAAAANLSLDIRGTAFQERVWRALREIPAGTKTTYSELARAIGRPGAARAVAGACAANPLAVAVPCHRVVRKNGELSGYRWGVERKRRLLDREASERDKDF